MASKNKKRTLYFYLFLTVNIIPLIGVFLNSWTFKETLYFYLGECALLAILAAAMYARYLIVFFLLTMAFGMIVYTANPALLVNRHAIIGFWFLYSFCWLIYIEVVNNSAYGKHIRRMEPKKRLTIYLSYLSAAVFACIIIINALIGKLAPTTDDYTIFYKTFIGIAILVPTISVGLLRIIDMIGQKHFTEFIMGTYYRPIERDRIVLFIDMAGSTSMAEKLEPRQSMKLIADFIYDCSYIFRIYGGDILNYTGDGLVVHEQAGAVRPGSTV